MVRTTDGATDESTGDHDIWATANDADRRLLADGGTDTVLTGHHYKDPDTCDLYTSGHRIAQAFHDVLQAFEDAFAAHTTVDVVAGGCKGCTVVDDDVDVWANYVAQGSDDTDRLYVGYGARDDVAIGPKLVAYTLIGIAEIHGVAVSWDGDTASCVCLGDASAYDD
jgi:hypothetical protein